MALVMAIIAWFLTQTIKCIIELYTSKEMSLLRVIFGSGGMPSSHSSAVCAVASYITVSEGIKSPLSSLAIVVAFIVMYDAMNVRLETGKQGKFLNSLVFMLEGLENPMNSVKFKELVGHTPAQVLIGGAIGLIVGVSGFCII